MQIRLRNAVLAGSAAALGYSLARYAFWHASRARARRDGRIGSLGSHRARVRGVEMYSRIARGAHPSGLAPVVLVHGWGVSSRYMLPIAERLALEFDVYVPDLPGHGLSGKPTEEPSVRALADYLAAWIDELGLPRAALVGNSFGNQIIVEMASRHPEKVDRLVLQGPTVERSARTAGQQAWRYFLTGGSEQPPLGWISIRDYLVCGVPRLARTFCHMLRDRIEAKLPEIHAPALVVRGSRDRIVSQAWAEEVARLLPNGRIVVIPGAAHAINFSYPDAFAEVIVPFLSGSDRKTPERLAEAGSGAS